MANFSILNQLRGVVLVAPWVVWLVAVDVAVSALLPLRPLFPSAVYAASSWLAESVWLWVQALFTRANGARVETSGDPLPPGESAVVVVNHVGWSDFYMIQALAVRAGMLGRCRYFAKVQLRRVPFLGWGLWALGMPMVSRRWDRDRRELDRVFSGIVDHRWPTWLISFSEATRYTPQKAAESAAWCAAHGHPQPRHLLYPRTRGFVATVQHLRRAPHVRAVYDLTIAYQRGADEFQAAPTMWETLSVPRLSGAPDRGGAGYRFHVHARRFPIAELPETDEGLAQWLEQRWVEKGEWLEAKRLEWAAEATKKGS